MPSRYRPHWSHESIDEDLCRASVPDEGRSVGFHQCCRKPQEGSEWCWQHSPEREAEREAEYRVQTETMKARRHAPYNRCIEILNSIQTDLFDPDADEFRRIAIVHIERERDKW